VTLAAPFLVKASPMSDPAELERTLHGAANALTVARCRLDLIRRRLADLPGDVESIDASLTTIRAALDRIRDDLRLVTDLTVAGGNRDKVAGAG